MTMEAPRNFKERLQRTLSPHLEEGGLIGRWEMDGFGWLYLLVLLVLVIPLIPLLVVITVLHSMYRSFRDPYRHPEFDEY